VRFGLSTHLFHGVRLDAAHIDRMVQAGFDLIEVFATRTHFDYRDAAAVSRVKAWLDERRATAWSVHLPITDGFTNGVWGRAYSNGSPDAAARHEAVDEAVAAIAAARDLGCQVAVLHLGIPRGQPVPPGDNDPGSIARSLDPIVEACTTAGVQLALEVIPNELSTAAALLDWLTSEREWNGTGVCLDVGHAHLTGGAPEAIELLAGYIATTHIHDNRGRDDDHLLPFDGTIDWPATLMAFSKVGYGGPLMLELPDHGDANAVLTRAASARRRIQAILDDLAQPFPFEGQDESEF
jgi:sugar phosphate isomerase/epimerase